MSQLGNVGRSRNAAEADPETQKEAASEKLLDRYTRSLNACANDDERSARPHAPSPPKVVIDGSGKEHSSNRPDIVHSIDKPSHVALDTANCLELVSADDLSLGVEGLTC